MAFVEQTETNNPFNGIDVGIYSTPSLGDVNGDGLIDLVVGNGNGTLKYFQNIGIPTAPSFQERTGTNINDSGTYNPFYSINVGQFSAPSLGDLNGDGSIDVIVGAADGSLRYYFNADSEFIQNPVTLSVGTSDFSTPALADLDQNGTLDLVAGAEDGKFYYFKNFGNPTIPLFWEQSGSGNPLANFDVGIYSTPAFIDIDKDVKSGLPGDPDLFSGRGTGDGNPADGKFFYFKNFTNEIGLPPFFAQRTGGQNPLDGIDAGFSSAPAFADLNGDGKPDLVAGDATGRLRFYLNDPITGTAGSNPVSSGDNLTSDPIDSNGAAPPPTNILGSQTPLFPGLTDTDLGNLLPSPALGALSEINLFGSLFSGNGVTYNQFLDNVAAITGLDVPYKNAGFSFSDIWGF